MPQDWASTQNNLGNALSDQGELSSGTQAVELFAQAVEAFRAALEVRTRTDMPQDWARTQNNLGSALSFEGEHSSGSQATNLFAQAAVAYRAALEVYTKTDLPQKWVMTQENLGEALFDQGERSNGSEAASILAEAASAFESVLEVSPASKNSLRGLSNIDHEVLFRFDRAVQLDETLVKIDPGTSSSLDFEEANLTVSNFSECIEAASTIGDQGLSDSDLLVRDTIEFACQAGAGKRADALTTAKVISEKVSTLKNGSFNFTGTLHYLSAAPSFESGRASWIALFESMDKGDGAAMAAAVGQLEEVMHR